MEIRDNYFFDTESGKYFIPSGISYIVLNPHAFSDPSPTLIRSDFEEIARNGCNSIRTELPWPRIHTSPTTYDWEAADYIVQEASRHGIKLFLLIGYQFSPPWVNDISPDLLATRWDSVQEKRVPSTDMLNLSNPHAVELYMQYLTAMAERYQGNSTIAAFILGNEFSFYNIFGDRFFLGFDDQWSFWSYRDYLASVYANSIADLNARWGTMYFDFAEAARNMATSYPSDHVALRQSGYHDLLQWRENVIADYVASGARAVKSADPSRLITYSMVGGIFTQKDAEILGEDAALIVKKCREAGAALDFWSINTYPEAASAGNDRRSISFSICRFREQTGLPVLVTETGVSTNDYFYPEAGPRAANLRCSLPWECLMSGAIGFHIFHWHDREGFGGYLSRENFFGIVDVNRVPKEGFEALMATIRRARDFGELLIGSNSPATDVFIYWSRDCDIGLNRAISEYATIWSAFRRRGYQVSFMNSEEFDSEVWRSGMAVYLGRNFQMRPEHLDDLETKVIASGVHVHASGDLPGQFDAWHRPNCNWVSRMRSIFGVCVRDAAPAWDAGTAVGSYYDFFKNIEQLVKIPYGHYTMIRNRISFYTWKIWRGVRAVEGRTILAHAKKPPEAADEPSLHLKDNGNGCGKSAIHTFAIGDILHLPPGRTDRINLWIHRSNAIDAVYNRHFGIHPAVTVSGRLPTQVVAVDHRFTASGDILISLLNTSGTDIQDVTVNSRLLTGRSVFEVVNRSFIMECATETVTVNLSSDSMKILHCKSVPAHSVESPVHNHAK